MSSGEMDVCGIDCCSGRRLGRMTVHEFMLLRVMRLDSAFREPSESE